MDSVVAAARHVEAPASSAVAALADDPRRSAARLGELAIGGRFHLGGLLGSRGMHRSFTFALVLVLGACGATEESAPRPQAPASARPESCPAMVAAPNPLPGVRPEHTRVDYWLDLQRQRYGDVDEVLLSPQTIADHAQALRVGDDPPRQPDLSELIDASELQTQVAERLAYLRGRFEAGAYVEANGEPLSDEARRLFATPAGSLRPQPELRVATAPLSLRCGPRAEGFYKPSLDLAFDRNNCSTVRAQEPIEVLMDWPSGMRLARTRYALGWIAADAPLSPAVQPSLRAAVLDTKRLYLPERQTVRAGVREVTLPAGTLLPLLGSRGLVATADGFHEVEVPGAVPTRRALTRRALLEEAFRLLGEPYGWGGHEGGRDCSRFLLDVFATFGLALPRHSARQAASGTFSLDVTDVLPAEKLLLMDAAMRKGVVLLHFPGHIMLYLGRDAEGEPMVLHSFSEYVTPCEGTDDGEGRPLETLHRVDRVTVSDLRLGAGSSRRDFLSRITKVVVFGGAPGIELQGVATLRRAAPVQVPADRCEDSLDAAVFRTPARPHPAQPLRVLVTTSRDPGPVALTLLDPEGRAVAPELHRTGGPPYGYWVEVPRPSPGRWTAVLGDGSRVEACERFTVARHPPAASERQPQAAVWTPRWSWERDTENYFAAFVEQLFREPVDRDITWTSLQELLRDPARNLLHDHLSQDEDARLALEPDCADLPYFLRAYFSWKLRLPFAWRQCSRGREGIAPSCEEVPKSNLMVVDARDDVEAFERLVRELRQNVHSSTQRTVPQTDASDVYPVALSRTALRPGTIFADPYGHILVVAAWIPQGLDRYGVLLGADAQPDGTVGRRRFWRGSFLFDPDTRSAGAGFKAWRPVVYDRRAEALTVLTNEELRRGGDFAPFSDEQYRGSKDDFYERVEALINPRPLEPTAAQRALVDALEEGVRRRVVSVDNGEAFMRERSDRPIEMPEGADIFQTEGPWEDFSTPSRDLRLLISIDAVMNFPARVARNPARFGLSPEEAEAKVAELRRLLDEELARRSVSYHRSDGTEQRLTLAELVSRAERLEVAYNPNDCIEIRWGAPEGSDELTSCRRRAPAAQRARMARYRAWFRTRERPVR